MAVLTASVNLWLVFFRDRRNLDFAYYTYVVSVVQHRRVAPGPPVIATGNHRIICSRQGYHGAPPHSLSPGSSSRFRKPVTAKTNNKVCIKYSYWYASQHSMTHVTHIQIQLTQTNCWLHSHYILCCSTVNQSRATHTPESFCKLTGT